MNSQLDDLAIYLHLARAHERRRRPLVRDKWLVLAAVAAAERQLDQVAQFCRDKILSHNPAHLVGRWPSLAAALSEDDFRRYVRRLTQTYPLEKAEHLLGELGIELARERALYESDHEYAAAILGTSPEGLNEIPVRAEIRNLPTRAVRPRRRNPLAAGVRAIFRLWRSRAGSRESNVSR